MKSGKYLDRIENSLYSHGFSTRDNEVSERKPSLMIFEKGANLKQQYGNRHFCCRGDYADTVGMNIVMIKMYIQKQLKEDLEYDQMLICAYIDLFAGEQERKTENDESPGVVVRY